MEAGDIMAMKVWSKNSLLGIEDLSSDEILFLLDEAQSIKAQKTIDGSITESLRGKRIINLFMEPSTRTRVAFEIAAKSLGADVISIAGEASSLTK